MRIELEKQDIIDLMYDAFCNGGLNEIYYCDVQVEWNNGINSENYGKARKLLKKEGNEDICVEDVFVRVFLEYGIEFHDLNNEMDEQTILLTYELAKKNLAKAMEKEWFVKEVMKIIPEESYSGDAYTGLNVLQGALYGEVIYG